MGTINYKTSKIITLGIEPYDFEDIKSSMLDDGEDVSDERVYDTISSYYEDDIRNAESIIDKYDLDFFKVKVEPGYYEGFSIDIDPEYEGELYTEEDRRKALEEVDKLQKMLVDLVDVGIVHCTPGWSTGYSSNSKSKVEIEKAMDDLRKAIESEKLEENKNVSGLKESSGNEKWREMTYIEDYEFDPDGKYDGSLYKEEWEEIFDELYQRAETTEEWRYNDWIDPVSTRNAYTYRTKKHGEEYIVLKYYDGMYALYEIKDENEIDEGTHRTAHIIEKITSGVSVRKAIFEAVNGKKKVFEDVAGMTKEETEQFINIMNKWTGGSGKGGWKYKEKSLGNNKFAVELTKNPICDLEDPVTLDITSNVLNGDLLHKGSDVYLAASGPITFAGLKSILRDLESQIEMLQPETEEDNNIYGY